MIASFLPLPSSLSLLLPATTSGRSFAPYTSSTNPFPRAPLRLRRRQIYASAPTESSSEGEQRGSTNGSLPGLPPVEEDDEVCPVECVTEFKTDEEFTRFLERSRATGALVVVDFFRPSCGSCKYIEQGFMKLCKGSGDHGSPVIFLKHNVIDEYDEQSEVAERLRIKVVPLFHFYKDAVLVESFATRDKERIIATITKYTSPDSAFKEP
ncbi:thioredoxin-like 4, chloroplastic isoform X3 [Brachypodium distachyon]|uniref:thioredoxin-like 4, chloroplastic isoform X3 n=1 Tax=Brachypodium distachyon TaxID=15368 RepID=UPI0005300225|nr:thioredoxin-like 4, chloroplastic isoform X3 [Brachypodium distachyon]|eukprot:XP_010235574.1 thioredoxin-like 4, chloroplastic isoform X3 [Brachypodium distachyon]